MHGNFFCYFHARTHKRARAAESQEFSFPVPEDFAAIQESIAKVLDGIASERMNPSQSSQILRGLQIALKTIPRTPAPPVDSVHKITLTRDGDELAQPLKVRLPALENPGSRKALPSSTGSDPDSASGPIRRLENVRAEVLASLSREQLLIGGEKLLRCLDKPDDPA
jgi:hypothetical protein